MEKNDDKKDRHTGYLVITRKVGESIQIGTSLVIVNRIRSKNAVTLSVQTDKDVLVRRIDHKTKKD